MECFESWCLCGKILFVVKVICSFSCFRVFVVIFVILMEKAKVSEVFSSIQGEGPYLGRRETFVRFSDCNLNCVFCDVEQKKEKFYTAGELIKRIKEIAQRTKWLTLTGGEPLLWSDFLKELLPLLKQQGYKITLETNGTLPEKFKEIKSLISLVSLDFKLPSSTGEKPFWKEHQQFLALAKEKSFVKTVITAKTSSEDLKKAAKIISGIDQKIPLILQPAAPYKKFRDVPRIKKVLQFQQEALKFISDVRTIPQMHKFLKLK